MLYLQLPVFLALLLAGPAFLAEGAEPSSVIPPESQGGIHELDWAEEKGRRFDLNEREAELEREMDHVKRELEKERIGFKTQLDALREKVKSGDGEGDFESVTGAAKAETQHLKEGMARAYFQYAKELGARADLRAEDRDQRSAALRERARQYERVFRELDRDLNAERELARKELQAHEPFAEVAPKAAPTVAPSAKPELEEALGEEEEELTGEAWVAR